MDIYYDAVYQLGVKKASKLVEEIEREEKADRPLYEIYRETKELLNEKGVW